MDMFHNQMHPFLVQTLYALVLEQWDPSWVPDLCLLGLCLALPYSLEIVSNWVTLIIPGSSVSKLNHMCYLKSSKNNNYHKYLVYTKFSHNQYKRLSPKMKAWPNIIFIKLKKHFKYYGLDFFNKRCGKVKYLHWVSCAIFSAKCTFNQVY